MDRGTRRVSIFVTPILMFPRYRYTYDRISRRTVLGRYGLNEKKRIMFIFSSMSPGHQYPNVGQVLRTDTEHYDTFATTLIAVLIIALGSARQLNYVSHSTRQSAMLVGVPISYPWVQHITETRHIFLNCAHLDLFKVRGILECPSFLKSVPYKRTDCSSGNS